MIGDGILSLGPTVTVEKETAIGERRETTAPMSLPGFAITGGRIAHHCRIYNETPSDVNILGCD
jgi:hypothetical protein